MATYSGSISYQGVTLASLRNQKKGGSVISNQSVVYKYGSRGNVRSGIDLTNFNFSNFERIPKERILNRFRQLGSNIKY